MTKKNIFSAGVIVLLLILGLLVLNKKTLANKLTDLKLLPQSEDFTELYLLNHQTIPYTIATDKELTFAFVIHNLENKDMNYPYEVYILIDGKKEPLVRNSIFIKNKESKTLKQSLSASFPTKRFEIGVTLVDKDQYVDFWVQE